METIGHIATVVMLGCLVWGLLGLFRPRLVLWWAWPSVQTRWKALAFALLASIAFFLVVVAARPSSDKWMWFLPMLTGALISTIIEKWGTPDSELVITKNMQGKNCLGLKLKLNENISGVWEIRNLRGRTILTNLLNLHASHIQSTEKTIMYLFQKYGRDIFIK